MQHRDRTSAPVRQDGTGAPGTARVEPDGLAGAAARYDAHAAALEGAADTVPVTAPDTGFAAAAVAAALDADLVAAVRDSAERARHTAGALRAAAAAWRSADDAAAAAITG